METQLENIPKEKTVPSIGLLSGTSITVTAVIVNKQIAKEPFIEPCYCKNIIHQARPCR